MTCTGTYTATQADLDAGKVDNTATADSTETPSVNDTATVPGVQSPALGIDKQADTASYNEAGDVLTYTIVATNIGNVTLHNVTVSDPKLGALVCDPAQGATLAPEASMTCTGTYTASQPDVDAGKVDNTATADSTETPSVNDSATVPAVQGPALGIVKTADTASYDAAGDILHYTIVATNIGNVTLHNVTVSDPKLGALSCTPAQPATLEPNASISCTGTYAATQADLDAGTVDNTATADSTETPSVDDSATVPAVQNPVLALTKGVSLSADGDFVPELTTTVGETVHYQIVVSNTGNVTLTGVSLSDSLFDLIEEGCTIPATLAVGASFTCAYTDAANPWWTENIATADSAETAPVADSATVYAPPPTALVIRKLLDIDPGDEQTLVPGEGWSFAAGDDLDEMLVTDADGLVAHSFTQLDGPVSVDLAEVVQEDFTLVDAACTVTASVELRPTAVGDERGTVDLEGATIAGIVINAGEIVTCTFVNESGEVAGETATPRVTPPPTSTLPVNGTPGGDSWRIVLMAIAGLLAMTLLLTPATTKARRRR